MKTQLLCTFSFESDLEATLDNISKFHEVVFDRIFVLEDKEDPDGELMVTYNISYSTRYHMLPSTISIHRKKETNTIYTINALNQLIALLNGGVVEKGYPIEWQDYRNSMLLVKGGTFTRITTKLYDIVQLN